MDNFKESPDIFSNGAKDKEAKKNLQTMINGASAYCPRILALVQDRPHVNIANTIRMFNVISFL